jgi:F-type H+-transporting ATPase subunit delta
MSSLVAKRYVKALMSRDDKDNVYNELLSISTAYSDNKFLSIIESSDVKSSDKVELIISFVKKCTATTTNLIKLLDENKRLNIIPDIVKQMQIALAEINNTYTGIVYTNDKLSNDIMSKIQDSFAKKFNVSLTLSQEVCDYNGIKVDIEGLGVEIAFSKDRLKSQMINHILKAV